MKKHLLFAFILLTTAASAQDIRFKYVAFNVPDKMAAAQWYHNTLGLKVIKSGSDVYVSDAQNNFRLKFFSDPSQKNSYEDQSVDAWHIGLEGDSISYWEQKIIKDGGKFITPPRLNAIGDGVADMRDPWGIIIQLVYRVKPLFKPIPHALRFEHLALNMTPQKDAALWYVEFMGLTIPWSKDPADATHPVSNYRVPYVGDPGKHMDMEFLSSDTEKGYTKLGFGVSYIAFEVKDAITLSKKMIHGGAKQIGDTHRDKAGNLTIRLLCPWGNMIELVQLKGK